MTPHEIDNRFQELQQELPPEVEQLAREYKVFARARMIKTVFELLRAVLLYSIADMPLRNIAGWFTGRGRRMSDQAVRWRLKGCSQWIEAIIEKMLPKVALDNPLGQERKWKLTIVDSSVVNGPGSEGTDYRLHLGIDPVEQKLAQLEIKDVKTAESLNLFNYAEGEIVMGDRGYAKARALIQTIKKGAQFVVRMTISYLPLYDGGGRKIDLVKILRKAGSEQCVSLEVEIRDSQSEESKTVYLHARRLSKEAGHQARSRARKKATRNCRRVKPQTLFLAEWLLILTSIPPTIFPADVIFKLYRVRWQVELVIKRWKSLLNADALRARAGSPLAELYLLGKLLFALLVESRTIKRAGTNYGRMIGDRDTTSWRMWKMIADEIKEAVLNTIAYAGLDWYEMLKVLGERRRRRKLQIIPDAIANWLRSYPVIASL
jgi:hypothetical protein